MISPRSSIKLRTFQAALLVALLLSGCQSNEYWIPPHAAGPAFAQEPETQVKPGTDLTDNPRIQAEIFTRQPDSQGKTGSSSASLPAFSPPFSQQHAPNTNVDSQSGPIYYQVQAADTLEAVAVRFGVQPELITSDDPIPSNTFLRPGQVLVIPSRPSETTFADHLLPDSEVVYSPSAVDFNTAEFIESTPGKLSTYSEWHRSTGFTKGAEIVQRVAIENSINPRLLLALLEYESGWVYGYPPSSELEKFPLGLIDQRERGLYNQLIWAINQLSIGYYAWREGRLTELTFADGTSLRLAPELNAGTVALMYYFSRKLQGDSWLQALSPENGLPALHRKLFDNPWGRAKVVEPLFPADIRQPPLILPFQRKWAWAFTGGPHGAWEREGAYAALDFAPGSVEPGCVSSAAYVVASSSGLVTRSGNGVVVLDLDGDGYEQTGWVLVYLHVSSKDRIPVGSWVGTGDWLGHPSCEGGISTGTHIHIARKFNGEWVPAAGPLPFNLGGWVAQPSDKAYQGTLVRDGKVVKACDCASSQTFIQRGPDDP